MFKKKLNSLPQNVTLFPVAVSQAIPAIKKAKVMKIAPVKSFIEYFKGKNIIWIKPKGNNNRYYLVTELFETSLTAGETWHNNNTIRNYVWSTARNGKKWNEFPANWI